MTLPALHLPDPERPGEDGLAPPAYRATLGWQPLRFDAALGWGALVALAMSTQLLFQPFVWRNFGADEIFDGWLDLLGQRLAVALSIAFVLALASRQRAHTAFARAAWFGAAIFVGAWIGEGILLVLGGLPPPDAGSFIARVGQWFMLAVSVAALHYLWRRSGVMGAASQATALRRVQLDRQVVQARLQALRSQIEPHFLFNTLATVRRLQQTEPDQGAQLLGHFLAYLRSTLPQRSGSDTDTLGCEVDLVRAYLGVVATRMAGRLTLRFDVPDALRAAALPPLSIATLVENAVKHGIAPRPEGGAIEVRARADGGVLEVVVADSGVGFSGSGGTGIGLANIRARLHTLYPGASGLALAARSPCGVCATMRLPLSWPAQAVLEP